MRTPAPQLLT